MMDKTRLLIFDALRIIAIIGIVLNHTYAPINTFIWRTPVYPFHISNISISIILFVSGAMLELNHSGNLTLISRLRRIYPAYWMSLALGLTLQQYYLKLPKRQLLWEFSGFQAYAGYWGGKINVVGWFIGLIVGLYIMYPWLSRKCRKHPEWFLLWAIIISQVIRYAAISMGGNVFWHWMSMGDLWSGTFWRWFPLANLTEFCLGIYIVQKGLYPTWSGNWLKWPAELTFYVYLSHYSLILLASKFSSDFWVFWPIYIIITIAISILICEIDQNWFNP